VVKPILIWLAVFALCVAPWFALTAHYAPNHSPVWPLSVGPWHGEYDYMQNLPTPTRFPFHHVDEWIRKGLHQNRLAMYWQSTMDPGEEISGDEKLGGWGPFYNVLCVPAIFLAVFAALIRRRWDLLALLAAVVIPWLLFPLDGQTWSRFILPVTLAGFIGLGIMLQYVNIRWLIVVMIALSLFWGMAQTSIQTGSFSHDRYPYWWDRAEKGVTLTWERLETAYGPEVAR